MKGEREIEEAPHQTEGSQETEPSFEAVMERGADLERSVEEGPEKLRAEAKQRLERMVNASDTTEEERREMPELEEAARELDEVQADARRLASKTKTGLGGIFAKAKKYGRGLAGAAALMGAMTFAEGCATMGAPSARAMESVERRPDRPTSEEVGREAIEALRANKALLAELGPEKVKEVIEAVESWDEHRIDKAIHDISGVPIARLEKERMVSVRVLSDAEWAEEKKKDSGFSLSAMAVTENDGMKVRASAFVRPDGKMDGREIRHTMTHEKIHGSTTDSDTILMGQQQRFWDPRGVATDLNEGVTELMAQRVMEKIGDKPDNQSYAGGDFAAAYLLERLVGTKELAADFFEGKTDRMKATLDAKFGKGTAEELLLRDRFSPMVKLMFSRPEGLAAALDMVGLAAAAGIDPRGFAEAAKRDGVREDYRISEKGDGLAITKEIEGKLIVANAAVVGSPLAGIGGKRIKVMAWTVGGGWASTQHKEAAEKVMAGAKKIEAAYAKTIKDAGLAVGWQNDPQVKAEVETVIKAETEAYNLNEAFNVVITISDEMKAIQDEYERETDPAKRKEIERRASTEAERLARAALADIEASIAAAGP